MRPAKPRHPERLEPRRPLAVDLLAPLPDLVVDRDAADRTIDLRPAFDLAGVSGTVVRLTASAGLQGRSVYAELFDQPGTGRVRTTPLTVANFLAYADAGRYTDTIIHRSVPGFVVQGGGFTLTDSGSPLVQAIPQFTAVLNEPGNTNVRGTLAMAKLGSDPNSATNQFFVSLADNSANLDSQNGGFTAFGRVLGDGMALIDEIAALPRYDYGTPFDELPAIGLADPATIGRGNLVTIASISRAGELDYSVASSDTGLVSASLTGSGGLVLAFVPGATGTATVTVRATSIFDAADFREDAFVVAVAGPAATVVNAVAGVSAGQLVVSRSTGSAFTAAAGVDLPADGGWQASLAGDFDGDGRSDVALLSAAGRWWVAVTPAAGSAPSPTAWASLRTDVPWRFPTAGDFTGDGRDDIAVWNPLSGTWQVLASDGAAFDNLAFGDWDPDGDWTVPLAGDFDGDGRADLAGRDLRDGAWHVSRSDGSGFTSAIWRRQRKVIVWQHLTAADFNGDGRTDIATWNSRSGAWRVLTSTGTGFDNSLFTRWDAGTTWVDVVAGDYDGDGNEDLVGRDATSGRLVVAISEATSFASADWGQLDALIAWQFVVPGDFDGDGRSDLAAWDAGSGAWRLLASTGGAFVGSAFGSWSTAVTWTASRGLRV